jgi:sterol 3beta-glucosyltransferase
VDAPRQNILLLLSGSRGDIQPATCLALELQRRNHHVSVLCTPNMVEFVQSMGVGDARPAGMNISEETDRARELLARRRALEILRFTLHFFKHSTVDLDRDISAYLADDDSGTASGAAETPDLIIANPLCQRQGLDTSEKLDVPLVVLRYAPVSENSSVGWVNPLTRYAPPSVRRGSWAVRGWVDFLLTAVWTNRFRRTIGLGPVCRTVPRRMADRGVSQLQLCDPIVVPEIAREWRGTDRMFTGYLDVAPQTRRAMGEGDQQNSGLDHWLRAGSAPVFVSFGSMPVAEPEFVRRTVIETCRARGLRVIFGMGRDAGVSSDGADTDGHGDVFDVGAVDQSTLLPRCKVAVHHGGAGTTAASLRAGIPTMIYSFGMEQPFWGERIRDLGIGTASRFSSFGSGTFARDLDHALLPETVTRAKEFASAMIPPEQALTTAVDIVESQII